MAVALTVYISLHYLRVLFLRDSVPYTSSPSKGAAGTEEVDIALSSLGQGAFVYLGMTSMFVGFARSQPPVFILHQPHALHHHFTPFTTVCTPQSCSPGHAPLSRT